jgi:RecA/RadA recombinase
VQIHKLVYVKMIYLKIATGSEAIDSILGGGVPTGMLTDIYGESGSGKSQLCFTLCANCAKVGGRAVFIDTAGTFRPERIVEIFCSSDVLEKITFVRALNAVDQISAVDKAIDISPQLLVLDTLTSHFSAEYSGPARHLAVMKHLHRLAHFAINSDCAVIVTNMIRTIPTSVIDHVSSNFARTVIPSQQREYLGSSVSIYSHIKMKLEIINAARSMFRASLVQPAGKPAVHFKIAARGIADIEG